MTAIESEEELERFESLFSGLWDSATVRLSLIRVSDDLCIPNGEVIFSEETIEERNEVLFSEGPFEIVERVVDDPFQLLHDMAEGRLEEGEGVDIELYEHNPERRFLNQRDSRVFDRRPRTEVHAVYDVEYPDVVSEEYSNLLDDLEYQLQRAQEPYYHAGKAEYYYFDHHFRGKPSESPEILVFAETGIEFDISDDHEIGVEIPELISDDAAVSVLPQRPYGEQKGRRIELTNEQLDSAGENKVRFEHEMDLEGIEYCYVILFVGDEIFGFKEYPERGASPSDQEVTNPRYRIIDEYDEIGWIPRYLRGNHPDAFEAAVLNTLSTAGYLVQWFGDSDFDVPNFDPDTGGVEYGEVDLIAYRPDGKQILFVECTHKRISDKESLLDRMEEIAAVLKEEEPSYTNMEMLEPDFEQTLPVIATSRSPEQLNDQVVNDYKDRGVAVLDSKRLMEIYELASNQTEPVRIDIDPEMWDAEVL